MKEHVLHLCNPATEWENASPIGNGSCGMMVFGGVDNDIITLNEESIWSSTDVYKKRENMPEAIAKMREMFVLNKPYEANEWIKENMGVYPRIRSYEYAGELLQRMNENNDEGILWNGRKSSMKLKRKWTNSSKTSLAAWASASATGAQRELHSHAVASNGAVHQP